MPGKLSTHVLDNYHGKPACGVAWELEYKAPSGNWTRLATGTTNKQGRTDHELLSDQYLLTGSYRLRFGLAQFYRNLGVPLSDPPFLDTVTLEFNLRAGESYHVPLAMTPWSYSTYRGS